MKTTKFKPSEVGPIPVEWEVKRFDDTFEHVSSKPFQIQSSEYQEGGKFQVVDQGQMEIVGYTDDDKKLFHVPREGVVIFGDHTRIVKFRESDFVVGADGTQLLIGKECCTRFLFYVLQQLDIPNLGYSRHFKYVKEGRYAIPPTLPEQKAIAEALSDMDALLAAMTTLIEKKRVIKQGAMQELLGMRHEGFGMRNEPIRRLAGFSGAWVEKRLGDIADFVTATTPTATIDLKWYIGTENMLAGKAGVIQNDAEVPYTAVREYLKGDVLISNIRPYLKKIWLADRDGGCSTDVLVIRTHDCYICIPEFLAMLLSDDSFFAFAMANAVGTKMPRGDKSVLMNFQITLPSIAEQKAIAAVLSDMDAEIAALEAKRAKYERIKQGMMQELLTGKTRLSI